jgi:hypothetical protein
MDKGPGSAADLSGDTHEAVSVWSRAQNLAAMLALSRRGRERSNETSPPSPRVLGRRRSLVEATFLNPSYSLRWQLFLSFGVTAMIVLITVTIMSCIAMLKANRIVYDGGLALLSDQTAERISTTASLMTNSLLAYRNYNEGALQLAVEFVRDRIVGYPYDNYEDDRHVPFLDADTNTNRYPLQGEPVPLDWQVNFNINRENRHEHLQGRWSWVFDENANWTDQERELYQSSSISGSFFFQGTCDPSASVGSSLYSPNCTEAHNNISTGGVVAPNNTTKWLHEKSAELQILFKALHESHYAAFTVTMYFFNSGAGATLQYPGMISNRNFTYVSRGCEWMRSINNYTRRPYGTEEQIAQCHPAGTKVPGYEYNPWEEELFAFCATNPDLVYWAPVTQERVQNSGQPNFVPVMTGVLDQK